MTGRVITTFAGPARDPGDVAAALVRAGFVLGPAQPIVRTLIDTFDGRLHVAGLRLECREGRSTELLLSGENTTTAMLAVNAVPRSVDDLPPGPFRTRISDLIDDRALLSVVRLRTLCTPAVRRDHEGKIISAATIWDQLVVADHDVLDMVPWTVDIEEVRGFAKHARTTRAVISGLGLRQLDRDTLGEAATAAGAHIGARRAPSDIVLDPAGPVLDGYRKVLAGLAATIAENWQGTIDETDIEFLHDFRIAVRRTRTVLRESQKVLPSARLEVAVSEFARLGSLTGPPRDLDVYLVEWAIYTDGLAPATVTALRPVRDLLEQRQAAAHVELAEALVDPAGRAFMDEWRRWLADPNCGEQPGAQADEQLADVVAKRIRRAHERLVEAGRLIRPDTPAENVHDLRKHAKKLRYLIECFASVLADRPRKEFVRRLKVLQDNLGVHQDAEVHVATLRAIAVDLHDVGESSETLVAIGQLTERIDQRRLAARAEFAERFAAYDTDATLRDLERALRRDKR